MLKNKEVKKAAFLPNKIFKWQPKLILFFSEEELVQKRMHELRHAQEIRQLYDMKLVKVDRIMRRINRLMQQMKIQKGVRKWTGV
jgi:hypothetical protein